MLLKKKNLLKLLLTHTLYILLLIINYKYQFNLWKGDNILKKRKKKVKKIILVKIIINNIYIYII